MRRKKLKKSYSKKMFSRTASKTNRKNLQLGGPIMRGGIRL